MPGYGTSASKIGANADGRNDLKPQFTECIVTPLIEAVWRGYIGIVEILARCSATNARAWPSMNTALHNAAANKPSVLVSILLSSGAQVDPKATDDYTLHVAVECDNLEAAQILIKKEANLRARDLNGRASLHMATCREMTELLVKSGTYVKAKTWTILQYLDTPSNFSETPS